MLITRKPIVLVPGFAGSKLVAKKNVKNPMTKHPKNEFINFNVSTTDDWKNIMTTLNDDVVPYDFGGINGIRNLCDECEYLDWYFDKVFKTKLIKNNINYTYFDDMITKLEKKGYSGGVDLVGVPYDFRRIMHPNYLEDLFNKTKVLIEKTYELTKKPSVIVSHSIGCLIMYLFLVDSVTSEWKAKYISKFISVCGPYGGCSYSLKTILSGIPAPTFLQERYHSIFQLCSGTILAFPNTLSYDKKDVIIIDAKRNKKFNTEQYIELMPRIVQDTWYEYIEKHLSSFLKNTDVDTTFVVSLNKQTDYQYIYDEIRLDGKPQKDPIASIRKLGDNLVHMDSLLFHMKNDRMYPNYSLEVLPYQEHSSIVKSKELFNLVIQKSDE